MANIQISKLNNGITVVTNSIQHVESVNVGYWVNAGGINETKEQNGISHFLEHMAFKGTPTRTAKQIAEEIEKVGGYLNAYTSREVTAYYSRVLGENLSTAMGILSDILVNPTFEQGEMELERNVILQEISQYIDSPDDIIFDHFQATAFPDQPMGRSILGTADIISKTTADDLRQYKNKKYNSILLAAAGNCQHNDIVALANDMVTSQFSAETSQEEIDVNYKGGTYSDFRPDLEQVHLILGFKGVTYHSPQYYTSALCSAILGEGMSSRLFQEVREKRGLCYSIYSFNSSYKNGGTFGIYTAVNPDKVEETINALYSEMNKMKNTISKDEMEKIKTQYKASLLMNSESVQATCEQIANHTMLFGRPLTKEEILEKINNVTIDMIEEYAGNLLSSPPTLVSVGNTNNLEKLI